MTTAGNGRGEEDGAGRLEAKIAAHREIGQALEEEQRRPAPDGLRVQVLKREKLRLKDEIARLRAGGW